MTIVEKILGAHAGRDMVQPGEFVAAGVDFVLANDITGPPTIAQFRRMGAIRVFDPDRVALVRVPVDQIYLGNCANGTLTDLRQAAGMLRGRHLARGLVPYVRDRLAGERGPAPR